MSGRHARPREPNVRLDGSSENIFRFQSAANHEESDAPNSDSVRWIVEVITAAYEL